MMVKRMAVPSLVAMALGIICFSGCKMEEGIGGTGTITGRVYAYDFDSQLQTVTGEYYAPEENVYIVYGENEIYNDRMDTHFDGSFRFQYLHKGKYSIYVYSDDTTGQIPSGVFPVIREVEITKNRETIDLGDLIIVK